VCVCVCGIIWGGFGGVSVCGRVRVLCVCVCVCVCVCRHCLDVSRGKKLNAGTDCFFFRQGI